MPFVSATARSQMVSLSFIRMVASVHSASGEALTRSHLTLPSTVPRSDPLGEGFCILDITIDARLTMASVIHEVVSEVGALLSYLEYCTAATFHATGEAL